MATDFAVKVVAIKNVIPHPNADRLDLCEIAGWQCVSQRGTYKAGDLAVYIPIDSVLPDKVERILFGPDSKIKLHKSRVKSIKIRKSISQGMLAPCDELGVPAKEGYDCTKDLGIVKYEPPEAPPSMRGGNAVSKKKGHPDFHKYGGLDNFKNYPELFTPGEEVVVTEKIHGTNFRFGWLPTKADTLWKKVLKLFGKLPAHEFVFGSNNVQLQGKKARAGGFYEQSGVGNVYEEAVEKLGLEERTKNHKDHIFYGEIYGDSIQSGYNYGCGVGERKFVGFDILYVDPKGEATGYLNHSDAELIFKSLALETVPVLFTGPYNKEAAKALTVGNSVMVPTQKVREGVVIRPVAETKCHIGRKVLKLISDEYLLGDNTDFH